MRAKQQQTKTSSNNKHSAQEISGWSSNNFGGSKDSLLIQKCRWPQRTSFSVLKQWVGRRVPSETGLLHCSVSGPLTHERRVLPNVVYIQFSISWRRDRLHFVEKRWSAMVMLLFVNHNNNSLIVRRKKKSIQNNSKNQIKSRAHGAEDYHE